MAPTAYYTAEQLQKWTEAQAASAADDLPRVRSILAELISSRPDSAVFCATYANTLQLLGDAASALPYFRRAVLLEPNSEKFSLGLFHCLWGLDSRTDAINEAKRFLESQPSAEYAELLASIEANT
jgi:predicted Zn-dependent protease